MHKGKILWADDEIDLLKSHIMFLNSKGYEVESVSNGADAVQKVSEEPFDIIFLDENMPGMGGLEALEQIKKNSPNIPVVMITKSEEEEIMEEAIGGQISDYLIKPVKPNQILLACKRILENRSLVSQKVNSDYQQDFRKIGMLLFDDLDHEDWKDIYKKLTHWNMEMEESNDKSMWEVLQNQQAEANTTFNRFVKRNYLDWLHTENPTQRPTFSPDLLKERVFPLIGDNTESVFFILVDCLRYDQWKDFEKVFSRDYYTATDDMYLSILPTATQYCRNSIFAGLHPSEIEKRFPKYWKNDNEDGGKNQHEADLVADNLARNRINAKHSYHKILNNDQGNQVVNNYKNLLKNDINFLVYNFIDHLSHARTDIRLMREMVTDEAAYRSFSRTWLEHSPLLELMQLLAKEKVTVVISSDHGAVRVKRAEKIIGDRETTTNLRYKQGRSLNFDEKAKHLFAIDRPADAFLPKASLSSRYVFAMDDYFLAYPNNYNHYVNYYKDTFQHGGISMEEMMVPYIVLKPKGN